MNQNQEELNKNERKIVDMMRMNPHIKRIFKTLLASYQNFSSNSPETSIEKSQ
jgi:hypothetical protein